MPNIDQSVRADGPQVSVSVRLDFSCLESHGESRTEEMLSDLFICSLPAVPLPWIVSAARSCGSGPGWEKPSGQAFLGLLTNDSSADGGSLRRLHTGHRTRSNTFSSTSLLPRLKAAVFPCREGRNSDRLAGEDRRAYNPWGLRQEVVKRKGTNKKNR